MGKAGGVAVLGILSHGTISERENVGKAGGVGIQSHGTISERENVGKAGGVAVLGILSHTEEAVPSSLVITALFLSFFSPPQLFSYIMSDVSRFSEPSHVYNSISVLMDGDIRK